MKINFYALDMDSVIDGYVVSASTTYEFALKEFYPLIGRLDIQRDALNTKFYSRLESDIIQGCVIPPITIALIKAFEHAETNESAIHRYINENLDKAFVLDGIQRLNTLSRASEAGKFNKEKRLYVNFIIAGSKDRLLYRMITLNNGQKPMSARHQIEILADSFFSFEELDMKLISEKGGSRVRAPKAFKKADFIKGYIAYLSDSVNIDNQKIIEEKMDELIASRIIESDISTRRVEFTDIVEMINSLGSSPYLSEWIRNQNNFIGFCVGIKNSVEAVNKSGIAHIERAVKTFEEAFKSINVSKVNIGKARRDLVSYYFQHFEGFNNLTETEILDIISSRL